MTKEEYLGIYSTGVYLPFSALSKGWRIFWRRRRGKKDRFMQETHLPSVSWRRCTVPRSIRLYEHRQEYDQQAIKRTAEPITGIVPDRHALTPHNRETSFGRTA